MLVPKTLLVLVVACGAALRPRIRWAAASVGDNSCGLAVPGSGGRRS
ncbi:hypothetical protein BAL199_08458 [alpha proteobacterium BAL199]|nr:hypothetical protein BAL199_08458 [alpha proteobacterium BAL199]